MIKVNRYRFLFNPKSRGEKLGDDVINDRSWSFIHDNPTVRCFTNNETWKSDGFCTTGIGNFGELDK